VLCGKQLKYLQQSSTHFSNKKMRNNSRPQGALGKNNAGCRSRIGGVPYAQKIDPKIGLQPTFFCQRRSSKINVCGRIFGIPWRNAVCDGEKAYIEVSNDFLSFERYWFEKKPTENRSRMQIFTVRAQWMNGGCDDGFQFSSAKENFCASYYDN
jgi:hypothetical protein